jgi:hypothetical protein
MAWANTPRVSPLQTIVPADWYSIVKANLEYLKGQAGTVQIESAMFFSNDGYLGFEKRATYYPRVVFDDGDYIEYDRINNKLAFYIGDALACEVSADRLKFANGFYSMDNGVAAACHIEGGTSIAEYLTYPSANEDAFTFVNAFSAAPAVACGVQHANTGSYEENNVTLKTGTLNTTGVTLEKYTGNMMISYFLAVGAG